MSTNSIIQHTAVVAKRENPILVQGGRRKVPGGRRSTLSVSAQNDVVSAFKMVWDGKTTVGLAKGSMSQDYCAQTGSRFESSHLRVSRRDGVLGDEIGATAYGKPAWEYMAKAEELRCELMDVAGGRNGEIPRFMRAIARALALDGVTLRPLMYEGETATFVRFARWTADVDTKRWLLRPHDDVAQTRGQHWEVSKVTRLVAINAYLSSVAGSGQLAVADWRPTSQERKERGLERTGYPYPEADLLHRTHVILPVTTGDVAVVDGSALHGVLVGEGRVSDRLIGNVFVGRIGNDAVYWG